MLFGDTLTFNFEPEPTTEQPEVGYFTLSSSIAPCGEFDCPVLEFSEPLNQPSVEQSLQATQGDQTIDLAFLWLTLSKIQLSSINQDSLPLFDEITIHIEAATIRSMDSSQLFEDATEIIDLPKLKHLINVFDIDETTGKAIHIAFIEPMNKSSVESLLSLKQESVEQSLLMEWTDNTLVLKPLDDKPFVGSYILTPPNGLAKNKDDSARQSGVVHLINVPQIIKPLNLTYSLDAHDAIILTLSEAIMKDGLLQALMLKQNGSAIATSLDWLADTQVKLTLHNNHDFNGEYFLTINDDFLETLSGYSMSITEDLPITFPAVTPPTPDLTLSIENINCGEGECPMLYFSEAMDRNSVEAGIKLT